MSTVYQSRLLWDASRSPTATFSDKISPLLYELTPCSLTSIKTFSQKLINGGAKAIKIFFLLILPCLINFFFHSTTPFLRKAIKFLVSHSSETAITTLWFISLTILEYHFSMGKLFLILTILALISAYGFSTEPQNRRGLYTSAYSVFNKGCEALLGSIDGEALARQMAAGGMGGGAMMAAARAEGIGRHEGLGGGGGGGGFFGFGDGRDELADDGGEKALARPRKSNKKQRAIEKRTKHAAAAHHLEEKDEQWEQWDGRDLDQEEDN